MTAIELPYLSSDEESLAMHVVLKNPFADGVFVPYKAAVSMFKWPAAMVSWIAFTHTSSSVVLWGSKPETGRV